MTEHDIIARVLDFIGAQNPSEAAFDELALTLFAYQLENNGSFRRFCVKTGKSARSVKTWRDIPPVPITAFKNLTLSCRDPETVERMFATSGTTRDGVRGKCYHPTLEVYDTSMAAHFKQRFMQDRESIRMGILFPTEEEMPNSSLAHYLAIAVRRFGTDDSHYLLHEKGLDSSRLYDELEHAQSSGEPYAILGATYSFVHLFDEMERDGISFTLPAGSRVLDTGGFKGRAPELAADDFYSRITVSLGVDRSNCINMYGMTELSTEFYDDGNEFAGAPKSGPHWIRTRIVDPLTGNDVGPGEEGILVHCDLANYNSVTTIMTEDVGVEVEGGAFRLLGRAQDAQAKGCSMAVEEFLRSAQG